MLVEGEGVGVGDVIFTVAFLRESTGPTIEPRGTGGRGRPNIGVAPTQLLLGNYQKGADGGPRRWGSRKRDFSVVFGIFGAFFLEILKILGNF